VHCPVYPGWCMRPTAAVAIAHPQRGARIERQRTSVWHAGRWVACECVRRRQVHYITAPQPLAAALVKYGDFLAPSKGAMRYGYGCLLYSHFCDFSTQGALRGAAPGNNAPWRWIVPPALHSLRHCVQTCNLESESVAQYHCVQDASRCGLLLANSQHTRGCLQPALLC